MLKQLRTDNSKSGGSKSKLLPEDRAYGSERLILCHVLKRSNCPHQPLDAQMEREEAQDLRRESREKRMHCASGARIALVKRSQKARGRPPKRVEESKSEGSVDSEFDYKCKK